MVDLRDKIVDYLVGQDFKCQKLDPPNSFSVEIEINGYSTSLECELSEGFPYEFPDIYFDTTFLRNFQMDQIPHIYYSHSEKSSICYVDRAISSPDPLEPEGVVRFAIERCITIIKDGIEGKNLEDFQAEFVEYWWSPGIRVFSFFTITDTSQILYYCKLEDYLFGGVIYITDNKDNLTNWLQYSGRIQPQELKFKKCIFIPKLQLKISSIKFIQTMLEEKIRSCGQFDTVCESYLLNKDTKEYMFVFSQLIDDSIALAGWFYNPQEYFKDGVLVIGGKTDNITPFRVEPLNRERLFYRGGDGFALDQVKVSITGCGSVGSYLTESLARLGVADFVLIDKEQLTSENVARHICGASDIGLPKTEAIKAKLVRHYPYIDCEPIIKNVLSVLNSDICLFNECDINFVVLANLSIEKKFSELFNSGLIQKPLIFLWVEPFLLGGHAVILQERGVDYNQLFDEEHHFKGRIIENGLQFAKREGGCQSTFIPYSAFEIQKFLNDFLDWFWESFINNKVEGNYLYSSAGRLNWARKQQIELTDKWLAKQDRFCHIQRLS